MNRTEVSEAHEAAEATADLKQRTNYDLVDHEVARYAGDAVVEIDEHTNKRLKKMIDKRILSVMMFTYFMQSLDKGTMSFASIMGIIDDTKLKGQEVGSSTPAIRIWCLN